MSETIVCTMLQDDICELRLNRPEKSNALNNEMILKLTEHLEKLKDQSAVRVVILSASGKLFCTGVDINLMWAAGQASEEENYKDALQLANLFYQLNTLPMVTIAKVRGGAMGGGIGLLCCCDMVFATDQCKFVFAELKLGLIAATIMPYVIACMGERQARRYILSAQQFDSGEAKRIGLVHESVKPAILEQQVQNYIHACLAAAPQAMRQSKSLIKQACLSDVIQIKETARILAQSRSSAEAKVGMQAFFSKSAPDWLKPIDDNKGG
ncbi:enoyl-CoA hydratase/isomerase family protein [Beggiatoa alba]|nr:enoyl-CoA hydratase/isomerase family protein [Beggiatoa alba]